jgi:hypothetical protein
MMATTTTINTARDSYRCVGAGWQSWATDIDSQNSSDHKYQKNNGFFGGQGGN